MTYHMPKNRPVPTLGLKDAKKLMSKLFATDTLDVAVFVDNRGGPTEISIIRNGDGQSPVAFINQATYDSLEKAKTIHPNNMVPFKSRRNHQYRGTGWLGKFAPYMMSAATALARLSESEKAAVGRAVRRFIGRTETPKSWERTTDGYRARLEDAGLVLTFGYSMSSGRYLSSVRRLPRKAAVAA